MSAVDTMPYATARDGIKPLRTLARITVIQARRSPMPLIAPLVVALFWLDALRTGDNLPAIWTQRASVVPNHILPDLGPIAAGMAAWIGGREHGRGMSDLAESTARPRWLRQLAGWGSALAWTLAVYAVLVAAVYAMAARANSWGGPIWWPVAVTGLAIALFCTIGFVAGAVFPGRFTAPLAALGTFFGSVMVYQDAVHRSSGWPLLSPNDAVPQLDWGVFHHLPWDLSIVQAAFLFGAIVTLLGVLGVVGSVRGAQLRRTTTVVAIAGIAVCATAFGFATTATMGPYGYVVPALHDTASDQPLSYTPVCAHNTSIPVCIHPAFANNLPESSAAFNPLLSVVAGLPGAPTRVMQIDTRDLPGSAPTGSQPPININMDPTSAASQYVNYGAGLVLNTGAAGGPVLEYGFDDEYGFSTSQDTLYLRAQITQLVIGHLIAPGGKPGPAQQAVEAALDQAAGVPLTTGAGDRTSRRNSLPGPAPGSAVQVAAQRFSALSPATRHAWLVANLGRLSGGQITLGELP